MVVLVARLVLLLSVLLPVTQSQSQAGECGKFRQESCQARGSQVLGVVRGVQSALECQVSLGWTLDCTRDCNLISLSSRLRVSPERSAGCSLSTPAALSVSS